MTQSEHRIVVLDQVMGFIRQRNHAAAACALMLLSRADVLVLGAKIASLVALLESNEARRKQKRPPRLTRAEAEKIEQQLCPGRKCRICGCTNDDCRQCIERTGKPCHWVTEDLCSACVPAAAAGKRGRR